MNANLINNPDTSKKVLCFKKSGELVAEYPSMSEAERETGVYHGSISKCCVGERKSAGGYVWRFV